MYCIRAGQAGRRANKVTNQVTGKDKKTVYAMSRRRRFVVFSICIAFVVVAVWVDRNFYRHVIKDKPKEQDKEQIKSYDFEKYHRRVFTVVNVVDGDTIDIDIPDGEYEKTRIRLWGVDTPETKSSRYGVMYYGPQASEFAAELVLGRKVTIYLEQRRTRGKYKRLLAYVQLESRRYLNEVLIQQGYGYADTRFRHSLYNKYKQLESVARRNKMGLWAEVKPQQMPEWKRKSNIRNGTGKR